MYSFLTPSIPAAMFLYVCAILPQIPFLVIVGIRLRRSRLHSVFPSYPERG